MLKVHNNGTYIYDRVWRVKAGVTFTEKETKLSKIRSIFRASGQKGPKNRRSAGRDWCPLTTHLVLLDLRGRAQVP